ncbi:hypothetical protein CJU89_1765 [Yarrowia sp. B02]|nr:hypothetical protein CJU89_1765 [Yarrowia sp. B02]
MHKKKDIEPPASKLEQQDISELRQQIDDFREEIRTSPVSYPKEPMADPHRRFAIPTDLSRFERLRRGLRREEDADINLGTNYSRYRMDRRNLEEEAPETRTTRVSKRDRDHNERSNSQTRLRSISRSSRPSSYNLHSEEDDFEDEYPEIKQESGDEDTSMVHPMPQLRRYAGYNSASGSPQKKVTIEEPREEQFRPRSRGNSDAKPEPRIHEAARLVEDKFEQYVGAIKAKKGSEAAQEFVREYQLMMDLLSKEYQGLEDAKQKQPIQKLPSQKPAPPTKKGIIKKPAQPETRQPAEDIYDNVQEEEDIFEEPRVKIEKNEEEYGLAKDNRRVQESMHELEREIRHTPPRAPKVVKSDDGVWTRTRSTVYRSYRTVVGAWYTTTSPLLLLATSFFFWQAIRLALTFFCLDDDEEFVRQQLVQGMSYAEIEHMWGLRGFNICGGVWRPPIPQ